MYRQIRRALLGNEVAFLEAEGKLMPAGRSLRVLLKTFSSMQRVKEWTAGVGLPKGIRRALYRARELIIKNQMAYEHFPFLFLESLGKP